MHNRTHSDINHLHAHRGGDARHEHVVQHRSLGVLAWALIMALGLAGVEVAAGFISNSLALISDAGHMVTDALARGFYRKKQCPHRSGTSGPCPLHRHETHGHALPAPFPMEIHQVPISGMAFVPFPDDTRFNYRLVSPHIEARRTCMSSLLIHLRPCGSLIA